MFGWFTNLRNRKSAKKHGWTPDWFGALKFDKRLSDNIKKFQRANNLWNSGICNRRTYKLALLMKLKKIRRRPRWTKNQ